ncbi:ornithine carbamoyltransferase [bacterium]|nr:ornithine carbamoyltransferase [bacterium]
MKKDLLAITDLSTKEIYDLFRLTKDLKRKQKKGKINPILKGKTLAMIFQKPSTRTRISFETGMFQLGGHALYCSPSEIGLGQRESVADVARVLSRFNDGIMARLFGHDLIVELAKFSSIPVINGLTDLLHPCQVLGDVFTILEYRGHLNNLKVAWIGDGNNVAHSWINMAARLPMKLHLACPKGYDPNQTILENAKQTGLSEIVIHRDPIAAAQEADIIYTDVWASMGQEKESEKRKKVFKGYQVDNKLVKAAKPDVKIMHCLPAHRGDEITDEVIEGPHSIVFDEAENRLHIQKAILVKLLKNG